MPGLSVAAALRRVTGRASAGGGPRAIGAPPCGARCELRSGHAAYGALAGWALAFATIPSPPSGPNRGRAAPVRGGWRARGNTARYRGSVFPAGAFFGGAYPDTARWPAPHGGPRGRVSARCGRHGNGGPPVRRHGVRVSRGHCAPPGRAAGGALRAASGGPDTLRAPPSMQTPRVTRADRERIAHRGVAPAQTISMLSPYISNSYPPTRTISS